MMISFKLEKYINLFFPSVMKNSMEPCVTHMDGLFPTIGFLKLIFTLHLILKEKPINSPTDFPQLFFSLSHI